MCVEKDFKLILLQYKLGDIILKEALEQVMDLIEKPKEMECACCEELKIQYSILCQECDELIFSEDEI